MSEPDQIGEILKSVFADLEKSYGICGRPAGPRGKPIPSQPAPDIGGDNGRMDKTLLAVNNEKEVTEDDGQRGEEKGYHSGRVGINLWDTARVSGKHEMGEEGTEVLQGRDAQGHLHGGGCRRMAFQEPGFNTGLPPGESAMTPEETVRRKIKLNGQAVKLIQGEMRELLHLKNLLGLEKFLQSKITQEFEPCLSTRLDAVRFLIESFESGTRSPDPCGSSALTTSGAPSPSGGENQSEYFQG